MQEQKDLRGVGIAFREGEQVEVVMSDVEILSKPCATHKSAARSSNGFQLRPVATRKTYIYTLV